MEKRDIIAYSIGLVVVALVILGFLFGIELLSDFSEFIKSQGIKSTIGH